ncbi:hypothetical protein DRH29_03815 [candidate division Kazan bacterium]|uniref:Bacterial sugar transferase domain-containing protein n=1 Tax=candidate division Kazan bacterium TaxID=2202143 RepID=A0A420ZC46_UNCK3|nr:MAG: hypothetical protein DRH29_03815 [candidate division Kazan bacterium]
MSAQISNPSSSIAFKLLLAAGDLVLLYLALWLALALRYQNAPDWLTFLEHAKPFSAVYILWLILFYTNNLYNLIRLRDQLNIYFDLARALTLGALIAVLVFYILPTSDLTPKRLLIIDAGILGIMLIAWRALFTKIFSNILPLNKVAILGITIRSLELGRELLSNKNSGYRLVALVGDGDQKITAPANLKEIEIVENPLNLLQHIKRDGINTLVVASDSLKQSLLNQLFEYLPLQVKFYNLPDFYEELTDKVPVTRLNRGWFLNNINETDKITYDFVKRVIDVVASTILLAVLSPIILLSVLAIAIDSRGPVIYRQKRVGQKNKIFTIFKLRTMVQGAERTGIQWTQKQDTRITRVGYFLRKTRLDEIPQLVNVLRGEMSIIGPRPERPEFINELAARIPFYQTRHLIKPGLTGWAQVKFPYGASVEDAKEKLQYDLYYIKHRSMLLDLSIIIRTIVTVLGFQGR